MIGHGLSSRLFQICWQAMATVWSRKVILAMRMSSYQVNSNRPTVVISTVLGAPALPSCRQHVVILVAIAIPATCTAYCVGTTCGRHTVQPSYSDCLRAWCSSRMQQFLHLVPGWSLTEALTLKTCSSESCIQFCWFLSCAAGFWFSSTC